MRLGHLLITFAFLCIGLFANGAAPTEVAEIKRTMVRISSYDTLSKDHNLGVDWASGFVVERPLNAEHLYKNSYESSWLIYVSSAVNKDSIILTAPINEKQYAEKFIDLINCINIPAVIYIQSPSKLHGSYLTDTSFPDSADLSIGFMATGATILPVNNSFIQTLKRQYYLKDLYLDNKVFQEAKADLCK